MSTKSECIFCRIIEKQIPAAVVKETEDVLVIKDRAPKMPIHYLIIPKKHIDAVSAMIDEDISLGGKMLFMAKELSLTIPQAASFRLLTNNGIQAGQSVFHLHFHFLAGEPMHDF